MSGSSFHYPGYAVVVLCITYYFNKDIWLVRFLTQTAFVVAITASFYYYVHRLSFTDTTPYKTMFQIQYFNVVTWTAIGLALILIFCFFLMVYMPLEPDTLLFGESAKIVGDE